MNRFDVLDAMNRIDGAQIEAAGHFYENGKDSIPMKRRKNMIRTLLIAAAITALMSVTAYATGLFQMNGRETAPGEIFPVHFRTEEGEVDGTWTATYALEFDGPDECRAVRCRFGWLPERFDASRYLDEAGWLNGIGPAYAEGIIPFNTHMELSQGAADFLVMDVYYTPQFVDDGALILMTAGPENIQEETWGELSVVTFSSRVPYTERDENGEYVAREATINYIVLFHPEQGWIFAVRGRCPVEELRRIAENLEVEQTDELVSKADFQNPYAFFDAARG